MHPRVPILMYHKVAPVNPRATHKGHYVPPRQFERQLKALKALDFTCVPLRDLFADPSIKRPVVITFDDGYRNFHTHALPALTREKFTATVFLVARQIDGTNRWDVAEGDVEEPLMSLDEIRGSIHNGIDFGSHTLNHARLDQTDPQTAWREIADSRCELEELLQGPVTTFAYPYGGQNPAVKEMVRKAGYRYACSTQKGVNSPTTDPFCLKRINVRRDTVLPVFAMKLWRGMRLDR